MRSNASFINLPLKSYRVSPKFEDQLEMSNEIISVLTERRTLSTSRRRTRTLATILSASNSGITVGELGKMLGVSEKVVSPLVQYLSDAGLLLRKDKRKSLFKRTPLGTRILNAFVDLHRMYGESITRENNVVMYAPCSNCASHPRYSDLAPVTFHENGKCMICNT